VQRQPVRVLSLFDGISAGIVALKTLGIQIESYFASEVDEDSIKCSKRNNPEIVHVGDVTKITEEDIDAWGPFDMLIGGSPCNDFSLVNKFRKGIAGNSGKLFFEYARILQICRSKHEQSMETKTPFYFLFENVIMNMEEREVISYTLGCNPVKMDAMYISPMKRPRLYWSNMPGIGDSPVPNPRDPLDLQSVLFPGRVAVVRRVTCITTHWCSQLQGKFLKHPVEFRGKPDRLWMPEIERCFGFKDHYTDVANFDADSRLRLLGMSWSIPCIRHLMKAMPRYFKSSDITS